MARLKSISAGVLNIKIHPHSPERYLELVNDCYAIGRIVKIRGSEWGMLASVREIAEGRPLDGLEGYFYRFISIDQSQPWTDIETRKLLTDEEGAVIPQIPDNLKPNTRAVFFVFLPRAHRLIFDSDQLSPRDAFRLVSGILADDAIVQKYGAVDVEIESSREAIERILALRLTKLEIVLSRPNQDDIGGLKEKILARMESQNARNWTETLSTRDEDGIKPDEETLAKMDAALSNGRVVGFGYRGEDRVKESTINHPLVQRDRYDPDQTTFWAAFRQLAGRIVRSRR